MAEKHPYDYSHGRSGGDPSGFVEMYAETSDDENVLYLHFTADHAQSMNTLLFQEGISRAAALELVNKWNHENRGRKYWIEDKPPAIMGELFANARWKETGAPGI